MRADSLCQKCALRASRSRCRFAIARLSGAPCPSRLVAHCGRGAICGYGSAGERVISDQRKRSMRLARCSAPTLQPFLDLLAISAARAAETATSNQAPCPGPQSGCVLHYWVSEPPGRCAVARDVLRISAQHPPIIRPEPSEDLALKVRWVAGYEMRQSRPFADPVEAICAEVLLR